MIWLFYGGVSKQGGPRSHNTVTTTYLKVGIAVEHLDRCRLSRVEDIPVIDAVLRDQAQRRLADPLPEHDVFAHSRGLELLLRLEIEDLQCPRLCPQGNNLARPVHDGAVGLDGASDDIIAVFQVNDENLGLGDLILLVADANERV